SSVSAVSIAFFAAVVAYNGSISATSSRASRTRAAQVSTGCSMPAMPEMSPIPGLNQTPPTLMTDAASRSSRSGDRQDREDGRAPHGRGSRPEAAHLVRHARLRDVGETLDAATEERITDIVRSVIA